MSRKSVLLLGASGMLGHQVKNEIEKLDQINLVSTDRQKTSERLSFDALSGNFDSLELEKFDYVINCIGLIKQKFKDDSLEDLSRMIQINSVFSHRLASESMRFGTKVIQICTDCVYSGEEGSYSESSPHSPTDLYGITKSLGESNLENVVNVRCSIVGEELSSRYSLYSWFRNLPEGTEVNGYTNHFWNGVTTQVFAKIVCGIIASGEPLHGMQHLVPLDKKNKFELLCEFNKKLGMNKIAIQPYASREYIDRTLITNYSDRNEMLWNLGGFKKPCDISEMIEHYL
jgi:dTDP-4-dehydrorhamnose reductase